MEIFFVGKVVKKILKKYCFMEMLSFKKSNMGNKYYQLKDYKETKKKYCTKNYFLLIVSNQ